MILRSLLFLTVALFTFSCGEDEKDNNPQPTTNDNSKIEGNWILKRISISEHDSLGTNLYESIATPLSPSHYYKFKAQGVFEESFLLNDGTFQLNESGNYNLQGNALTINLPGASIGSVNIQTGNFHVDTLTATKLTFQDTLNYINNPGTKYQILRISLYR